MKQFLLFTLFGATLPIIGSCVVSRPTPLHVHETTVLRAGTALREEIENLYEEYEYKHETEVAFCLYGREERKGFVVIDSLVVPDQRRYRTRVRFTMCEPFSGERTLYAWGHTHPRNYSGTLSNPDIYTFLWHFSPFTILVWEENTEISMIWYRRTYEP
jgi:hypothetical protein